MRATREPIKAPHWRGKAFLASKVLVCSFFAINPAFSRWQALSVYQTAWKKKKAQQAFTESWCVCGIRIVRLFPLLCHFPELSSICTYLSVSVRPTTTSDSCTFFRRPSSVILCALRTLLLYLYRSAFLARRKLSTLGSAASAQHHHYTDWLATRRVGRVIIYNGRAEHRQCRYINPLSLRHPPTTLCTVVRAASLILGYD